MAFRVEIAPRAFADLDEIAEYIKQHGSADSAERWFNGIIDAIAALKKMPARCPIAEESEQLGYEVHVLLHGRQSRLQGLLLARCPGPNHPRSARSPLGSNKHTRPRPAPGVIHRVGDELVGLVPAG